MKKLIIFLSFIVFGSYSIFADATSFVKNNQELQIGGKIHFEEESGIDYLGTQEINQITRNALHELLDIETDSCAPNAKILLTKTDGKVKITHYEEKSRPGVGEEMHDTLLYTKPRGFCDSETLEQVSDTLFGKCESPQTIENVAKAYRAIIKPEWRFKISEVVLNENGTNSFISAKLLFDEKTRLYKDNKPISATLHLTLVNCSDSSLLASRDVSEPLIKALNKELKGKLVKVAAKNGVADLEFGLSGCGWRIRAEERVEKHDQNHSSSPGKITNEHARQ